MIKRILSLVLLTVMLAGSFAFADTTSVIDDSEKDAGIVKITYTSTSSEKLKVLVLYGDKKISYPYPGDGTTVAYPLQYGNGTYKVGLLKNLGDNRYAYVSQKDVTLNLTDPNVVYLNAIQNINWDENSEAVVFGEELLQDEIDATENVTTLYNFLVEQMSYDYGKITGLTSDYVPSIDLTYETLKGICYDYSALLAGIERSQGIPTKLVKGYSRFVNGYHAWNEVYLNGEWYIVDTTVDSTLKGTSVKVTMVKNNSDYQKVNEY